MLDLYTLALIKTGGMLIMFAMVMIAGNIPIRSAAFKENKTLLSLTGAFSGGLFLSVGIIHLLPESQAYFNLENRLRGVKGDQFPYAFLITVLSFAAILYIEKVLLPHPHPRHTSTHCELHNDVSEMPQAQVFSPTSTQQPLAPYILQVAIGIHAIFEGLAIGIVKFVPQCVGITLAVCCHKWAEGLTLGLAFRKAGIPPSQATLMILIQALMNPMGVCCGWILSSQGNLIAGVFESISAGTFLYIATMELIREEFESAGLKNAKMVAFLLAVGFISAIWFLEQQT